MMIAVENLRSRFNSALGLTSQGFKDRCEIPPARVTEGPGRLRRPPAAAVHRGLPDARQRRRRRGRRAGHLAALVGRRPRRGRGPAAYLVRIVSRLALDRLGSAHTRRETYVGPWLPEPLVTESGR